MTLKKLSSKRVFAVCRTQLYQMRLLLILFGLVILLAPTLVSWGTLSGEHWQEYELRYIKQMIMAAVFICGFAPMFGLGMGMAVQQFGYLHKRQKLDYFHAAPVLRSEHYIGRIVAALFTLISASVLIALGQIFSVGISFGFHGEGLFAFILRNCLLLILPSFSAYLFTVLMIVLTATLWETVFSLLAVSALSPAVVIFANSLIQTSMPIYEAAENWDLISVFSPLIHSVYYVVKLYNMEAFSAFLTVLLTDVLHILIAGGLSMLFFCRRKSELAESGMPTKFKLLVRFSAAFCGAALLSFVMLWITESYAVYWVGAIAGIIIAWLIMEILYTRSLKKAMRSLWINLVSFALIVTINVLVMTGMIGLPRIPDTEDVFAVSVQYGKETMDRDMASSYRSFNGNNETVYSDEGQSLVSMATWDEAQIDDGVALAKAMLENQKDLYFPYIPRYVDGYSRYDVTFDMNDAADEQISYDVTLYLYANGEVLSYSYGDLKENGRIEELYERAVSIAESEEYRRSNPTLVMMDELTRVQYMNYDVSDEYEQYELSDVEDPEALIQRLKAAYIEDLYSFEKGNEEYVIYEKTEGSFIENTTIEAPVPTSISDEYTLYLDASAEIVLEGGILDYKYPAEGFKCRLSPEFTAAFDKNAHYWTNSASIYFYRTEFPRTCAVLDELRADQTAE